MSVLTKAPFVLGFPTETVYGLAARIDEPRGIEAIFKLKQRPFFDPLIVHISNFSQLENLVSVWSPAAQALAQRFWPGPLTLVVPKHAKLNPMITSGLESVGVRWPAHSMAIEIINAEGVPLAAPSANRFGRTSPTTAEHVRQEFGPDLPIRDGGPCQIGLESTVLRVLQDGESVRLSLLRPGKVTPQEIESCLSEAQFLDIQWTQSQNRQLAPGQMKHHYMPEVPLILVESAGLTESEILAQVERRFAEMPDQIDQVEIRKPQFPISQIFELNLSTDPTLAAREFYANLRQSAKSQAQILVFYRQSFHQGPDWQALWDRLTKAASLIV